MKRLSPLSATLLVLSAPAIVRAAAAAPISVKSSTPTPAATPPNYSAKCAMCHGARLQGGVGPALAGRAFWVKWQGKPARTLYGRVISTMPLNKPGSLSSAEALKLVSFIAESNGQKLALTSTPASLDKVVLKSQ